MKHARNHSGAAKTRRGGPGSNGQEGPLWLWGRHAVAAALANPQRACLRLVATENAARRLADDLGRPVAEVEVVSPRELDALLPNGAVHQGLAIKTQPLAGVTLDDLLSGDKPARVCVLDQVSDPQNLGAVFRSAAAFGVGALILQTRHSPPITGAVAKSAAGAAETVTDVRVVNIARALETLAEAGYRTVGLAGGAGTRLDHAVAGADRLAIVLGAEGAGLRPAVAKACDVAAHIPIAFEMESLNLSNAAAIAFYEAARPAFSAEPGAGM